MKKTLILTFEKTPRDIKTRVYRHTLNYIAGNLENAEVYQFRSNKDLTKHITSNKFSVVVSTCELSSDTAFLLKGLGVVQIIIGIREALINVSDIMVDPLVSKSEHYLVGTEYLLPSILKDVSPSSIAKIMGIKEKQLVEEVNFNRAENELLDVAELYKKLEWDSDFFGYNVGYISCLRLTPNIEKHIKRFIRQERISLLEYLCNCHDRESVVVSEKNGYSFVDMRLTFERSLQDEARVEQLEGFSIGKGKKKDIEKLKEIATGIYKYSRYYFDSNFDNDKVIQFYLDWIEKAIHGQFDDFAYVLYKDEEPVGFCSIKKPRKNLARIGLVGLSSDYVGRGLGKYLLKGVMQKLKSEEGIGHIEVATQGRNYPAIRLYQKCGFLMKSTGLWYHKWLH